MAKHYSFDDFCSYVLPYRVAHELSVSLAEDRLAALWSLAEFVECSAGGSP